MKFNIFRKIKKKPLTENYLWIAKGLPDRQLADFARKVNKARAKKQDIITNRDFELIPANKLVITFSHTEIKSKTHLLKTLNKAIGDTKMSDIVSIIIEPEYTKIVKYVENERD